MDRTISTTAPAPPSKVYDIVADLTTYQHWLTLVHKVEVAESNGEGDAWWVTLRAKVGPFARSKRLRMVRVVDDAPNTVRFERRELDEKVHSAWVMETTVTPNPGDDDTTGEDDTTGGNSAAGENSAAGGNSAAGESTVAVHLTYDGELWSGILDSVLGGAIDSAISGLSSYVADHT